MTRRLALGLALAVVAALGAGCGTGPSPLASPTTPRAAPAAPTPLVTPSQPGAAPTAAPGDTNEPATTAPSSTPVQSATSGPSPIAVPSPMPRFTLTSDGFQPSGSVPVRFTCDGRDISPAIAWTGVPAGTKGLVLTVRDPDARNFTHWIAYAIAPATTRLAEGAGTANSTRLAQGTNDFGRVGYGGPCPPSGTHRYVFTLYALDEPLGLSGAPNAAAVNAALGRVRILGEAQLTAIYHR
jgi:Raf kinase inhibitor-like YbhB/YbcL family protein